MIIRKIMLCTRDALVRLAVSVLKTQIQQYKKENAHK